MLNSYGSSGIGGAFPQSVLRAEQTGGGKWLADKVSHSEGGVNYKGYGISGRLCYAELELLGVGGECGGICWFYGEREPNNFKVVYEGRTTVLEHISGKRIVGVEHLSAAALSFQNCEFKLNAPQGELPLLDGSARVWKEELSSITKGVPQSKELNFYKNSAKNFEIKTEFATAKFSAFQDSAQLPCLFVSYSINRFNRKYNAEVKIETTDDLQKILEARTFIFEEELALAKLSENLTECGVLIKGGTANFRFPNEPAYHKILDLIGDISLYKNKLPSGSLIIYNGGHKLHHDILKSLLSIGNL
ncbi:hypothetical protein AGMMS49938_01740 [Fibrobacterales bacterium]|nr:hypothetical protein AGMMS49938_01740 [Fibrobacterales bacterium]